MRYSVLGAFTLLAASALLIRAQDPPAPPKLETLEQKCGYALGHQIGSNLKQQGAYIDIDSFALGMREAFAGTAPVLSQAAIQEAFTAYQKKLTAERTAKQKEFLEKNKTAEGVQVTESGLQYKVVKEGDGKKPLMTDTVVVSYEGTLVDGTVFDSSYRRGAPATFQVSGVIKGWTEALQLMPVGSTWMLYIPAELAYGDTPPPGPIQPGSTLIFKVELLQIKAK